jgi:hypothetical protein
MSYPVQRTMLVLGMCLVGGPVLAQDRRPVVQAPILSTDFQKPGMLPSIPTSGGPGGAVPHEDGHGGIKDVTPSFIPGRAEPVPESREPSWAQRKEAEGGWYAFGEVLLMKPRRAATDYGILDGANDIVPRGKADSVIYDFSPGIRVGVGYGMEGGWSVGLAYTNLRNSDQRSLVAPATGVIYPTLTRPGLVDNVTSANADVHLEYDVFDLEMRRKVCIDEGFAMKWGGGVKMASIRQELNAFYNGRDANVSRVLNVNDFYGIGPSFGGEAHFLTMGGLSFYSKATGSLLVGDLKTGLTETNNRGTTIQADLQDKVARVIPVVSVGVGLSYSFRSVKASLGYEVTNYFGLIQRPQFVDDFAEGKIATRTGDFSLDGFAFRLGWDY